MVVATACGGNEGLAPGARPEVSVPGSTAPPGLEAAPPVTPSPTAVVPSVAACTDTEGSLSTHAVASVRVVVYLPPCASAGPVRRRYRTLYLLHGGGADETQWPAIGLAERADELIASREIVPMIVVMPDSGLDAADSSIVDSIVPWVDANLPVSGVRAIGGISAGGVAAMRLVAGNPGMFSRLGGHSPVVDVGVVAGLAAWGGPILLDVGTGDGLRQPVEALARGLEAAGARVELRVWPGQHDRPYWGAHVADYLRFYGAS
jgi:enterochelin esterase-like enzyme